MIFRSSIRNEFLLLFFLLISIVLSLRYKPTFIFSSIISNKCRDSNKDPNHYHMKNKQRHPFHGNTLFSRRLSFIKADLWDLKSIQLKAYVSIFRKCLNTSQNNSTVIFYNACKQDCQFLPNAYFFSIYDLIVFIQDNSSFGDIIWKIIGKLIDISCISWNKCTSIYKFWIYIIKFIDEV